MTSQEAREFLERLERRMAVANKWYGFTSCPMCGATHVAKTFMCRGCDYKIELLPSEVGRIIAEADGTNND